MTVNSTIQNDRSFLPPKNDTHFHSRSFVCIPFPFWLLPFLSNPFSNPDSLMLPSSKPQNHSVNLHVPTHQFPWFPPSRFPSLHQSCIDALGNSLSISASFSICPSLDKSIHCVSLTGPPVFCCALQSGQCTHGGQRAGRGARQPCTSNKALPCSTTFSAAHHAEGALLSDLARIWWLFDPFWWITVLLRVSLSPLFKYTHSLPCFYIVFPFSEKCSKVHRQKSS